MKIMLIDDNKDLCSLTQRALIKHGYEVAIAHNALSGLKDTQNYKPNLILMDVMLPGINGAEAVRTLKKDPQLKNIPIVFLTGLVDSQDAGLKVDGVNYPTLGKPYEIEKLLEVVQKNIK